MSLPIRRLAAACLIAVLGSGPAAAQDLECRLTTAYLTNFAAYIEWPSDSFDSGFFEIVVTSGAPCSDAVLSLEGSTIQGHPARVRLLEKGEAIPRCDLLWTTAADNGDTLHASKGCLAVGPGVDFAELGGGIGLYEEGKKLRFAINLDSLSRAELKPSSKLLRVGKVVGGD